MSGKLPSKLPVPVKKPNSFRKTTTTPVVNSKPNRVFQKTARTEGGSNIFRNVVRIGHKDTEVYRKTNRINCVKVRNVNESVEPLYRAQKLGGKDCRTNHGKITSKINSGVRAYPTLKTNVNIPSNKRDRAPVNHQNVKLFNKMSSVKSKVSGGTTDTVCKIPVLKVIKPRQNLPKPGKKLQHVVKVDRNVVQASEQHSSIIIREPEIVQDVDDSNLPGPSTTISGSTTAVAVVPTLKSQKLKITGLRKFPSLKTSANIPSNKRGGTGVSNQIVNSLNEALSGIGKASGISADIVGKIPVQKIITGQKNVPHPVKRLQKTRNFTLSQRNVDQSSGQFSSIRKWNTTEHLHELDNIDLLDVTTISDSMEAATDVSTSKRQNKKKAVTFGYVEYFLGATRVPITAEKDDLVLEPSRDIIAEHIGTPSVEDTNLIASSNQSSSIRKRKDSAHVQEVDNGSKPDAKTKRSENTNAVADVDTSKRPKDENVTFRYFEYSSAEQRVTITAGKDNRLLESSTNIVPTKTGVSSIEEVDLVKSISSFLTLEPMCNINSNAWKKCASYVLRKRKTTWEGECRAQIPEKYLQVCVDRETKDVSKEEPFERTLQDIYMTVYMKWYAFQQIASRVTFEVLEIKAKVKATILNVIREGVTSTITHGANKFLCVKNVHRDDGFGNVFAIEVHRNKLYYTSANNVWSLSLVDARLPVMQYENFHPLHSFSVFGEKMHCLIRDPFVLDICSLEQPKEKLKFQVCPSYNCSQRNTFRICDEGVIVGIYHQAQTPHNQIFEVFMLQGKQILSMYCQNVTGIFSSNISCFYSDGDTFLIGLEFGVVMLYHVTSWDTFNLASHVKVFEGFKGGIRNIRVVEFDFQRVFVIETDCKTYGIFGAVCH